MDFSAAEGDQALRKVHTIKYEYLWMAMVHFVHSHTCEYGTPTCTRWYGQSVYAVFDVKHI